MLEPARLIKVSHMRINHEHIGEKECQVLPHRDNRLSWVFLIVIEGRPNGLGQFAPGERDSELRTSKRVSLQRGNNSTCPRHIHTFDFLKCNIVSSFLRCLMLLFGLCLQVTETPAAL